MSEELFPREELYKRFRESLRHPVAERFFAEDELIDLFDYAGDIADDYIQLEVLFCGARLYPESRGLAERRILLYLDTTIDESDEPSPGARFFLEDNPEVHTPLFDIVRIELNRPEDPVAALEFFLSQYSTLNDEETIRLLNLAFNLDQYPWVIQNMERLRKTASYLPTLLYEVMQEADRIEDNDTVIKLANELIEIEPFVIGYWTMLFKAYARAEKKDEAMSTFDTACALSADNTDGLMTLAESIFQYAPYLADAAIEILENLKKEHPDDFIYVDCMCALLMKLNMPRRAVDQLTAYLDEHPENAAALRQLLMCNARDAHTYVERFYAITGGFDEVTLSELFQQLNFISAANSIVALGEAAITHRPDDLYSYIESLFSLEKYREVAEMGERWPDFIQACSHPLRGPATSYCYVVSLMKCGLEEKALAHLREVRPAMENAMVSCPMPVRMAIRCLFTLEEKVRKHPASETLYWEYFDMLSYNKF